MTVLQIIEMFDMTMYPLSVSSKTFKERYDGYDEIAVASDDIRDATVDYVTKDANGKIEIVIY